MNVRIWARRNQATPMAAWGVSPPPLIIKLGKDDWAMIWATIRGCKLGCLIPPTHIGQEAGAEQQPGAGILVRKNWARRWCSCNI